MSAAGNSELQYRGKDMQPGITASKHVVKFETDQWHHYRSLAKGNHLRHWIDGKKGNRLIIQLR